MLMIISALQNIFKIIGVMDIFQDKFKTIASNGHFSGSFF